MSPGEKLESSGWKSSLSTNEYERETLYLDTAWQNFRIASIKRKCKNISEWLEDENENTGHSQRK